MLQMDPSLGISNISKSFDNVRAVSQVSFEAGIGRPESSFHAYFKMLRI